MEEDIHVIAIDNDPSVKCHATALNNEYGDRFNFVHGSFGSHKTWEKISSNRLDAVVFDIGVSSMQVT